MNGKYWVDEEQNLKEKKKWESRVSTWQDLMWQTNLCQPPLSVTERMNEREVGLVWQGWPANEVEDLGTGE